MDGELAWAVAQAKQPGADRAALVDVILRLAGEVRQQLGLQLSISRTLVDFRAVKEFQETVIEIIGEESPVVRQRIVERLKARRARRPRAELPTVDGDPMALWRDPLDELIEELDRRGTSTQSLTGLPSYRSSFMGTMNSSRTSSTTPSI